MAPLETETHKTVLLFAPTHNVSVHATGDKSSKNLPISYGPFPFIASKHRGPNVHESQLVDTPKRNVTIIYLNNHQ